jgi:hypothetical protein
MMQQVKAIIEIFNSYLSKEGKEIMPVIIDGCPG